MLPLQITVALRVDSFTTYAYIAVAFTRWSFFIVFRLNNKNNSSGPCDRYTRMLQINTPLILERSTLFVLALNLLFLVVFYPRRLA